MEARWREDSGALDASCVGIAESISGSEDSTSDNEVLKKPFSSKSAGV